MDRIGICLHWFIIFNMEIDLENIAKALVAQGKGILAADESFPTIEKRFLSIGISSTESLREEYRKLLFTTSGIEKFISGIIDRKSTRLNSSHTVISYAVFCL